MYDFGADGTTSGNASGSVCPKGWTLPSSEEYYDLIKTKYAVPFYDDTKIRYAPLSFNGGGYYKYSDGSVQGLASSGWYWSRTAVDANQANNLYFTANSNNSQVSDPRGYGYAVRCVGGESLQK